MHYLEVEVVLCIVVADVLNHLTDTLLLIACEWDESVLDVLTYEVTECATEVLMTWI